jgi:hypothetical protein
MKARAGERLRGGLMKEYLSICFRYERYRLAMKVPVSG